MNDFIILKMEKFRVFLWVHEIFEIRELVALIMYYLWMFKAARNWQDIHWCKAS